MALAGVVKRNAGTDIDTWAADIAGLTVCVSFSSGCMAAVRVAPLSDVHNGDASWYILATPWTALGITAPIRKSESK